MKNIISKENIAIKYQLPMFYEQKEYLLDGDLHIWEGEMQKVFSPIEVQTEEGIKNCIGAYPLMDEAAAMNALHAAVKAYQNGQGEWPCMTVEQRIACVKKFLSLMSEERETIVRLLMWEIGKSYTDSCKEFDRTIDYINDTIEALKNLDRISSRFTIEQGIVAQIRRAPLGVVLCMGPFNYPLNETFTTLIPALIMGNTIVVKPPKLGILLYHPLLKAFQQAFPKGVVNTIYGRGQTVVTPIMKSGLINVLAFIGSSRVADTLKREHPHPHRLKCVLGLDAKNPAIILKNADLEIAVKECTLGALSFNGQRCTALKILFVHESIADQFVNRMAAAIDNLILGLPWDENVSITPLPENQKPQYLQSLVEDALQKGAKIVNQNTGKAAGSFFAPVVLDYVTPNMQIYNIEQFGPIVPIVRYQHIEEPMKYVVDSNYGQQASLFGEDSKELATLIDTLVNQVCRVNINSQCQRGPDTFPFTGRKDSAEGTLSVSDALRVFSIRTLVAAKKNEKNNKIITQIVKNDQSNFLNTDFIL